MTTLSGLGLYYASFYFEETGSLEMTRNFPRLPTRGFEAKLSRSKHPRTQLFSSVTSRANAEPWTGVRSLSPVLVPCGCCHERPQPGPTEPQACVVSQRRRLAAWVPSDAVTETLSQAALLGTVAGAPWHSWARRSPPLPSRAALPMCVSSPRSPPFSEDTSHVELGTHSVHAVLTNDICNDPIYK